MRYPSLPFNVTKQKEEKMKMNRFTQQTTDGYTDAELDALNAELAARLSSIDPDDTDALTAAEKEFAHEVTKRNHEDIFLMHPVSGFVQTETRWRDDAEYDGWDYDADSKGLIWVKWENNQWEEV